MVGNNFRTLQPNFIEVLISDEVDTPGIKLKSILNDSLINSMSVHGERAVSYTHLTLPTKA